MTAHRPAPICLTLTGAVAALALVASTWTMPADVSTAPPAPPAQSLAMSTQLAQAPMDAPDDALPAAVAPSQAATPADAAPTGEGAPVSGLLYALALLGTGLAAACRRDGA